jgi:hypothetical protein
LAILYAQQEAWDQARACAEHLMRLEPRNRQWKALFELIRSEAKRNEKTVGQS